MVTSGAGMVYYYSVLVQSIRTVLSRVSSYCPRPRARRPNDETPALGQPYALTADRHHQGESALRASIGSAQCPDY